MRRECWPVGPHGVRPAGPQDECFYCRAKLRQEHNTGCVIRQKTVVIAVKVELVIDVPEDWDKQAIEFKLNGSSSCADNLIQSIYETMQRKDQDDSCMCQFVSGEYLRDATEQDEEDQLLKVTDLPS